MKRKGFTLVELLAVIVILAIISIITIPMIGNVIEDSKKKALETSVYGLVEAANYYAIYNDEAHVVFGSEAIKDPKEILDYTGTIDAEGDLYIDKDGDVSLCLMNEKYYVYKNYNSGIVIGDRSKDSCKARYDDLTNKYIAYLESEGEGSNVYDKATIDDMLSNYAKKSELKLSNEAIASNTDKIGKLETSVQTNTDSIAVLQNSLGDYALQSSLETLSTSLNTKDTELQSNINSINNNLATFENKTTVESYSFNVSADVTYDEYTVQNTGWAMIYYSFLHELWSQFGIIVNGQNILGGNISSGESNTGGTGAIPLYLKKGDVVRIAYYSTFRMNQVTLRLRY